MPNWVTTTIKVRGNENELLNLINLGLRNSNLAEATELESGFDTLVSEGTHKAANGDAFNPERDIITEKGVTMGTFKPIPDTFLKYDTTNHADKLQEQADEQKRLYGVVGWYDFNRENFGTKWDADCDMDLSLCNDGEWELKIHMETAWSIPMPFIDFVKEVVGRDTYIHSYEEGGSFVVVGKAGDKEFTDYTQDCDGDDWDDWYEQFEEAINESYNDFLNR